MSNPFNGFNIINPKRDETYTINNFELIKIMIEKIINICTDKG